MPLVRYARELGWLTVWDPQEQRWHEVWGRDCPPEWRRQARLEKERRQGPPITERPSHRRVDDEVAF